MLYSVRPSQHQTKGSPSVNRTSSHSAQSGFHRAIQMLSLAIAHVLYRAPDAARTNLRASWDCLKHSAIGRIEHMATTAFVSAVNGNVDHAVHILGITRNELHQRHHELPPEVRAWVWERCVLTMERLPYAVAIHKMVDDAYNYSTIGNYAEALYLLTRAGDERKRVSHLISPRTTQKLTTTWNDILERMLNDRTASALACVREYSARLR